MLEVMAEDVLADVAQDFDLTDPLGRDGFVHEMVFRWSDERMHRLRRIADRLNVAHSPRTTHDVLIRSIATEWADKHRASRVRPGDAVEVKPGAALDWLTRSTRTTVKGIRRTDGNLFVERTVVREAHARPDQITVLPATPRPDP